MPYFVNGELITDARIRAEEARIRQHLKWRDIPDEGARAKSIRAEAEFAAIDALLLEQMAACDSRPVDPALVEQQLRALRVVANGRNIPGTGRCGLGSGSICVCSAPPPRCLRAAAKPTPAAIEAFYQAHRDNFRGCAAFQASHIVKHVNAQQSQEQARAGIEAALTDLEGGASFAEVADRHSDCQEKSSDPGEFLAGTMVQEFETRSGNRSLANEPGTSARRSVSILPSCATRRPPARCHLRRSARISRRSSPRSRSTRSSSAAIAQMRAMADIRWIPGAGTQEEKHEPGETVVSL